LWPRLRAGLLFLENIMGDVSGNAPQKIEGSAAHDVAVSGNPLLQGLEARQTLPTAVANADAVRSMGDDLGRPIIYPFAPRDRIIQNRIVLTSTTETTLIAALASIFRDLIYIGISNDSATLTRVDFRDSTAGTIRFSMAAAASGGGASLTLPVPLLQATVNNNWTAQLSVAVTSVYLTALAIENN